MSTPEHLREHVARLEATMVDQAAEGPIEIVLVGDEADCELARNVESWKTYEAQLAAAPPAPPGIRRIALIDCDVERHARRD
jgi:hypothetical protein